VKDISLESFVSDLLIIGIDSEIQKEEMWVEGTETKLSDIMKFDMCGWDGDV
jgi:hypothetical protein